MEGNPLSFLNIDRAETQFDDSVDIYADCVYEKARELLDSMIERGIIFRSVSLYIIFMSLLWRAEARTELWRVRL